jgi:hypothetical protein
MTAVSLSTRMSPVIVKNTWKLRMSINVKTQPETNLRARHILRKKFGKKVLFSMRYLLRLLLKNKATPVTGCGGL